MESSEAGDSRSFCEWGSEAHIQVVFLLAILIPNHSALPSFLDSDLVLPLSLDPVLSSGLALILFFVKSRALPT